MEKYTVKQARMLSNISIRKMAKVLGMTTSSYVNKEHGKTRFYFDEAVKFSNAVNIPIDNIFFTSTVAEK